MDEWKICAICVCKYLNTGRKLTNVHLVCIAFAEQLSSSVSPYPSCLCMRLSSVVVCVCVCVSKQTVAHFEKEKHSTGRKCWWFPWNFAHFHSLRSSLLCYLFVTDFLLSFPLPLSLSCSHLLHLSKTSLFYFVLNRNALDLPLILLIPCVCDYICFFVRIFLFCFHHLIYRS